MNKQRSMLVEISVIAFIIITASLIIWNTNFFSNTAAPPVVQMQNDTSSKAPKPNNDTKWAEGKSLFKSNCASCHNPTIAQTGPALMGVTKRWEDAGSYKGKTGKQWLYIWIKNWNDAAAAGYPYAVTMSNYSPSQMNVFPSLKDEDIDKILLYVETPQSAEMNRGY